MTRTQGISPAISWILLVGFAVALGTGVSLWINQFAQDTTNTLTTDVEAELQCADTSITAKNINAPCSVISIHNTGLFTLHKILLRSNTVSTLDIIPPLPPQNSKNLNTGLTMNPGDTLGIVPVTLVNSKEVPCFEKEVTITC